MKELVEHLNDLKDRAEEIVNIAKSEKRAVSDEERKEFDTVIAEINDLNVNIKKMEEKNNMDTKEIRNEQLEKDIKNFASIIRNEVAESEMSKGANGVIIPSTIARKIIDKVIEISPLYASATKYNSKGTLIIPKVDNADDDVTVAYAEEFSDLTSHSNKFASVSLTGFLIGALTKVSKSLINNSDFDLVNFVINRMAEKFAKFYEKEMLYGTEDYIEGIVGTYDDTNMKVEYAGANPTADELIDIQELIPDVYQAGAYWIMNRTTRGAIRKLKDGQNNYLLNQVFGKGWDYELLGKPVHCSENVVGTDIFYGDFSGLAVKETEEVEITVLKEKYATQHAVGIVGYAELDAKVENTQKIAVGTAEQSA